MADKAVTIAVVIYHATRIVGLALVRFGGAVAGVFGKVWDIFAKFYASVLRPFVEWSWRNIVKLHAWLKSTLSPVFHVLDTIRRDILKIYNRWVRPILDTIDAARSVLRVLAEFHIPFAQAIDDKLAALEERLLQPLRIALAKLNEVVYWLDRIVDFNGLFQRLTFIATQITYVRDTFNVLFHSQNRPLTDDDRRAALARDAVKPFNVTLEETRAYVTSGAGPHAPIIDEMFADLRLRVENAR